MNWLVILVIGLMILMTVIGYKRGFIKIVLSLLSMIVTLFLTSLFTPYVKDFLMEETAIASTIQTEVSNYFQEALGDSLEQAQLSVGQQMQMIEDLPLPNSILQVLKENNNSAIYDVLGVDTFTEYISGYLTQMIMSAIAFVLTFLLVYVIVRIVFFALNFIGHLPIIKGINKLLGGIVGFIQGIILLWLLSLVLTAFSGTEWGIQLMQMVQESALLSIIYNNNVLLKLILHSIF